MRAWQESGGTRTYFLYDGLQPVCYLNASGQTANALCWGVDGLVSINAQEMLFDPHGSPAHLWSGSTWSLNPVSPAYGAANQRWLRAHGYLDTGDLVLATFRHYDPARGRWLTRDPIGYAGGVNLYGYVGGDPVNATDGLGLGGSTVARSNALVCGLVGHAVAGRGYRR